MGSSPGESEFVSFCPLRSIESGNSQVKGGGGECCTLLTMKISQAGTAGWGPEGQTTKHPKNYRTVPSTSLCGQVFFQYLQALNHSPSGRARLWIVLPHISDNLKASEEPQRLKKREAARTRSDESHGKIWDRTICNRSSTIRSP